MGSSCKWRRPSNIKFATTVYNIGFNCNSIHHGQLTADVNSTGIENKTALHCAVLEKQTLAVNILLRCGANPNAKTTQYRTPLHIACILGQEEISKLLLASGASLDLQDLEQNTPIHYAAFYRKNYIINRLKRISRY